MIKSNKHTKFLVFIFLACMSTQSVLAVPADDFVTTWKTDNLGSSNSTSITVPMIGGPYNVDWDNDGTFDEFNLTGSVTHDYSAAGTYTIRINGVYDSIQFAFNSDRRKILSIVQWGTSSWTSMYAAFKDAIYLTVPATDTPDFSVVTNMSLMFSGASLVNPDTSLWNTAAVTNMSFMFNKATLATPDTSLWNTAAVTNMSFMFAEAVSADPDTSLWTTAAVINMKYMFRGATSANPNVSDWTTAAVIDMSYMFRDAVLANPDVSNWDVTSLTNATGMFKNITLSTTNYEGLLIGWSAQVLQTGVTFDGGNSVYCTALAATAKDNMIVVNSWAITDGGRACTFGTCNLNMVPGGTENFDVTHEACELLSIDPSFTVANNANVTLSSGWAVDIQSDFTVEVGSILDVKICGLSLCEVSPSPMPLGCHSCVDQICAADPSCCNTSFDQACLDKVDTVCGLVCN